MLKTNLTFWITQEHDLRGVLEVTKYIENMLDSSQKTWISDLVLPPYVCGTLNKLLKYFEIPVFLSTKVPKMHN